MHTHCNALLLSQVDRLQVELEVVTRHLGAYKEREGSLKARMQLLEDRLLPRLPPGEASAKPELPQASPGKVDYSSARHRLASRGSNEGARATLVALSPSPVLNQGPVQDRGEEPGKEWALAEEAMTRLSSITEKLAGSIDARLSSHRGPLGGGRTGAQ